MATLIDNDFKDFLIGKMKELSYFAVRETHKDLIQELVQAEVKKYFDGLWKRLKDEPI